MYIHQATATWDAQSKGEVLRNNVATFFSRIRTQLLGGIFAAVLAPAIIRGNVEQIADPFTSYQNSIVGTLCALIIGFMVFRKVTALPGANALMSVLPAFLSSYGLIVALFFMLRIDYSRYQFAASFALVTGWFLLTLYIISRLQRPVMSIVMGGAADNLLKFKQVRWLDVKQPDGVANNRQMPLVVDLTNPEMSDEWERTIAEEAIAGRPIFNAKQLYESLTGRVQIQHLSENTFGHLAPDSIYAPAKRYIDAFTAAIALVFFAPVLLLVAAAIKLDSRGPAIFQQRRMGYRGQEFTVYKFRSMRVQTADEQSRKADITQSEDDRITRVGRFIRKTRLDELPQIVNILRGEMSWIGPRPEALRLSQWYEAEIPFYRYRHIVRPGISGWAQVKQGHVADVDDVREKLEYDLYYIKHFSIWMDILIGIKTIQVMITGHGAK